MQMIKWGWNNVDGKMKMTIIKEKKTEDNKMWMTMLQMIKSLWVGNNYDVHLAAADFQYFR